MSLPEEAQSIASVVCRETGVSIEQILSKDRSRKVTLARQIALVAVSNGTNEFSGVVGTWFGLGRQAVGLAKNNVYRRMRGKGGWKIQLILDLARDEP